MESPLYRLGTRGPEMGNDLPTSPDSKTSSPQGTRLTVGCLDVDDWQIGNIPFLQALKWECLDPIQRWYHPEKGG